MATTPGAFLKKIAVSPLVSASKAEESHYLGAMLADLIQRHLGACGLPVIVYNDVARALIASKQDLPFDRESAAAFAGEIDAQFLVYGAFILDPGSAMLGVRLTIHPDTARTELETSAPLNSFSSFIPRLTLSIIERFGMPITDDMRQMIMTYPRPEKFEAFQQIARARLAWMRGEHELALTAIDSALSIDPDYEDAMFLEVMIARAADDVNTAHKAFKRWAQLAIRQGKNAEGAERIGRLGHWLLERGEWSASRTAYENALALFGKVNDEVGQLRMSNNLANLDLLQGKNLTVIRRYRRSLREFEASPEFASDRATTYLNLGIAYKNQGQFHEAGQALEEAYSIVSGITDQRLEAFILGQQGALYADIDRWDEAMEAYNQALAMFIRVGDHAGKAMIRSHQALLSRSQGNFRNAEVLLRSALTEIGDHSNVHIQAIILYNLADLYLAMDDCQKGLPLAQKANEVFTKLGSAERDLCSDLVEKLRQANMENEKSESPSSPEPPETPFLSTR